MAGQLAFVILAFFGIKAMEKGYYDSLDTDSTSRLNLLASMADVASARFMIKDVSDNIFLRNALPPLINTAVFRVLYPKQLRRR
jgi:hypothetical protein